MERIARHVFVTGRVQGVGFRWSACEEARRAGLDGWVRNLADGRVELWVEGPRDVVRAMLVWLHEGPPAARVRAVDVREGEPTGRRGFEPRRTSLG